MIGRYYYYPPSMVLSEVIAHATDNYRATMKAEPDLIHVHPDRYEPLPQVAASAHIHATGIIYVCQKDG